MGEGKVNNVPGTNRVSIEGQVIAPNNRPRTETSQFSSKLRGGTINKIVETFVALK